MKRLFKYLFLVLTLFVAAQTVSADDVWNFDASTGHLTVYKDVNYDYDLFYYLHEYQFSVTLTPQKNIANSLIIFRENFYEYKNRYRL